jgi:hypothetical protein
VTSERKAAGFALAILAAVAAFLVLAGYFLRTPQMGTDEDAFKTVDALFTAIQMKDEAKLAQCESRLHAHRDAGRLAPAAAAHLDRIIARARAGEWEPAGRTLYDFMLAQRRQ